MKTSKLGASHKTYALLALVACCLPAMSGCASPAAQSTQIVTPAMTIVPSKPIAPAPETASQRDVAVYIVLLRGWGNAMAIQLNSISKLLEQEQKDAR